MRLNKIYTLFLLPLVFSSCIPMDSVDNRNITITNKTDKTIYCFISQCDSFPKERSDYADPLLEKFSIQPRSTCKLLDPPIKSWDSYINKSVDNKCRFLVISKDTVNKYGWDMVKKESKFIKKYLLAIDDLDKINWEISYDNK